MKLKYKRKGRTNRGDKKKIFINNKSAKKAINEGQKMFKIEMYAKDNNVTMAKAMIHFM